MRGGVKGGAGDGDDSDTEMLNNLSNGNSSFMNNDFEMMKVPSLLVLGLAIHLIVGTPTYDDGGKTSN